jgi:hypothetical protein
MAKERWEKKVESHYSEQFEAFSYH